MCGATEIICVLFGLMGVDDFCAVGIMTDGEIEVIKWALLGGASTLLTICA